MTKKSLATLAFTILLLVLAFGSYFAAQTITAHRRMPSHDPDGFHRFLHHELNLTETQNRQIQAIEDDYHQNHQKLEASIRRANAELAAVIQEENSYTPRVQEKVEAIHHAMGELQKVTLEHIYAMYPHLTPDQQQKLQTFVADALVETTE
jgi:Spy/CpxP family protein refolding chaperone